MKKSITILLLAMLMGVTTATAEDQYVYVAGKKLNVSANYTNVTEGLVSGSYTFYSSSKRLVLNNVTIERDGTGKNAIDSNLPGLRIDFVGTTNIKTGDDALALRSSTDMYGQGTLNITSGSGMAVHIFDASAVSFRGGNWTLNGKGGIVGKTNDGNKIVSFYDNVANYPFALSANGSDGSIWDVKVYFYNNLSICNPIEAYYNSSTLAICPKGSTSRVKGEDVIIGIPAFQLGNKGFATNQTEIKGSNISGTVTYNKSTKTVTMESATVTGGPFVPLLDNMTLYLSGDNSIKNQVSIKSTKNLTITGSNEGKLTNVGYIDLRSSGTAPKLLIKDVSVYVYPDNNTLIGINSTDGKAIVEVDHSSLHVTTSNICIYAKVKMTGSAIYSPVGVARSDEENSKLALYDESKPGMLVDNKTWENIKGVLKIWKGGTAWDLWVCGVQVNSYNQDKLSELMDEGQCTYGYDSSTGAQTLTLNKVKMNSHVNALYTLYNRKSGIVINLQGGTSVINNTATTIGIRSEADFTINGNNNELRVFASQGVHAISLGNATMTINNANRLYAKGGLRGISTDNGCVKVNNSYLYLYGTNYALHCPNFDPDENCHILTPTGGVYVGNSILDPISSTSAKTVEIRPRVKYNLWLNNKPVHEDNVNDLNSLLPNANGTISFNPSNNKLTLNNFQVNLEGQDGGAIIESELSNLELNLTGTNSMSANKGSAMKAWHDVTVTGTGSLDLSAKGSGVFTAGTGRLTLKDNATLNGRGETYGVFATYLTMNPGTELSAYASASNGYSLYLLTTPVLNGVALPGHMYLGKVNSNYYCAYSRVTQQPVRQDYVIINSENLNDAPTDIQVADIVAGDVQTRIYTTSGVLMWEGTGRPQLPSGIYIMKRGDTTEKVKL